MPTKPIVLRNRHLTARFDAATGALTHLSATGRGTSLMTQSLCRYYEMGGKQFIDLSEAASIKHTGSTLTVTRQSPHLSVTFRYDLAATNPLLNVQVVMSTTGEAGKVQYPSLPRFAFASSFVNQFEDEQDLYFDGAELGGGRELPCWRVFFQKGHRTGLMLATRSRRDMARFNIIADGFEARPNLALNYSTSLREHSDFVDTSKHQSHEVAFEIGAWSKATHRQLLNAAKLNEPVHMDLPAASGKPPAKSRLKGEVFHAARFASREIAGKDYSANRWMIVPMPWAAGGTALFANTGIHPPDLTLDPKLIGLYRVIVGVGNGAGATLQVKGDPEKRYRISPQTAVNPFFDTPFQHSLSGKHAASEVDFGVIDMAGKSVRIGRHPDPHTPCVIDYIRFEKLTAAQSRQWLALNDRPPALPLSGFTDVPDITWITDALDPDPGAYRAVLWEHANSKVNKCYWRIDGQCSDYPSKVNTMRYTSAKVHGVFNPQSKSYGRALKKVDMLKLAVDASRKYGVSLWGWMRFNSYMGNVASDFFKQNPRYHDAWETGLHANKLCLYHKAVREHKISILVEAAKYGLDGVCLGFLRHPPVLGYAKVMCDAYKRKYGKLPPSDPQHPDAGHRKSLPQRPNQAEYEQWWRFRAQYLTTFGRELKKAFKANGLAHVKIAIWVRPNHCLFDGIDIDAWLNEGLCHEVISSPYGYARDPGDGNAYWEDPQWKAKVRAKVPLIRDVSPHVEDARHDIKYILENGYDGINTYESNQAVMNTPFIELYRSLRK